MALVQDLKTEAQSFTGGWVDYGSELSVDGAQTIAVWVDIDVNDTNNACIRLLAKHTQGGADEYVLPIKIETATVVNVEDEYFELITDEDAKRIINFTLDKIVPYVQFQIKAETPGATPGQILSSKYTKH